MAKSDNLGFDLSGLEQFDIDGLGKRKVPGGEASNGKALMVPRSEIYPDPDQPRRESNPGFSVASLEQMGDSIVANGCKTPLIVRSKDERGYMIRDGERRYRGAGLKNVEFLPILIDDNFDRTQQLMVNLQREDNTVDEIINGIAELEEEQGMSRADIARKIGVSKAFVTEHMKFRQISPLIRALYENGICHDLTLCNRLDDLLKSFPDDVRTFVTSGVAVTRSTVADLSTRLKKGPIVEEHAEKASAKPVHEGQTELLTSTAPAASTPSPNQALPHEEQPGDTQLDVAALSSSEVTGGPVAETATTDTASSVKLEPEGKWPFPKGGAAQIDEHARQQEASKEAEHKVSPQGAPAKKPAAAGVVIEGLVGEQEVTLVLNQEAEEGTCWVQGNGEPFNVACAEFVLVRVK